MPNRRQFLRDCSVLATAASLTPAAVLAQSRVGGWAAPERLRFEHFAQQLNTSFRLGTGFRAIRLVLVEARRSPPPVAGAADARNERFCLVFRGPAQSPLEQETYLFAHTRLGRLAVFIVPTPGPGGAPGRYYEAVFNYPVHPADVAAQLARAPQAVRRG